MAPSKTIYGRKCRSPLCWDEVGEKNILEQVQTIDLKFQEPRNKKVKLVKVIWQNQAVDEAT